MIEVLEVVSGISNTNDGKKIIANRKLERVTCHFTRDCREGGIDMKGPLDGIRVIDISAAIAGPWGAMILGDLGAEVIKVEPPQPYQARVFAGPDHKGETFYHLAFNRSKKSVALNLHTKSGMDTLLDLIRTSDVLWDNWRPKAITNLNLDYDHLVKINPKIITCSVTGYGASGPYRDRPSFDIILLSLSGICDLTGYPDGGPLKPGIPIADLMGGTLGALATCAALAQREKTGKGQRVDVALLDGAFAMAAYELTWYFCSGEVPKRHGSGHLALVPYNIYKCQDGRYIAVGLGWPRIARAIGLEWMIDDPRFATHALRLQHRDLIDKTIQDKLMEASSEDWLNILEVEDVSGGLVQTIAEAAEDPQIKHRNMVLELAHPLGGKIKLAGNPMKMPDSIDDSNYLPPPTLGQHNYEVLCDILGYPREKVDEILKEGAADIAALDSHLRKRV